MRSVPHNEVVEHLEQNGYDTGWVSEYDKEAVERLSDSFDENVSSEIVLDWSEIEGQVYDGLFEDPNTGPEYDFTEFLYSHDEMVGRMMYYMVSVFGKSYDFESLVDDIEKLSNNPLYDAPFDRERALSANPE